METKTCKECGETFSGRAHKEYCSSSCRGIASNKRKYGGIGQIPDAPGKEIKSGNAQTDFIISELTRKRDKLDRALEQEMLANKALKEKLEKAEKEFADYKNEQRIQAIQNEKPSGLSGLLETQTGAKILEVAAPLIQRWLEGNAKQPQQIAGTTNGNSPAEQLLSWLGSLPLEAKQNVWKMLTALATMEHKDLSEYSAGLATHIATNYQKSANG